MKIIQLFLVFLSALSAMASQGVVLAPGQTLSLELPNSIPFSSVLSTHLDLRFHSWTQPSDTAYVVNFPEFQVRLMGPAYNAPLAISDFVDAFTAGQGNTVYLDITGLSDVIIRVQRDTAAGTFSAQAWSADGSGPVLSGSLAINGLIAPQLPAPASFGGASANCVLDYARWYTGTVPSATSPFTSPPADLGDWEFDGGAFDSSPQGLAVTPVWPMLYANSPAYSPYVTQGPQRVLRAGVPQVLSAAGSSALDGSNPLNYQWSQISGPTQLQWNSARSATPTVIGLVFGSYRIQLTGTDSFGQSSSCILKYGAVYTDANDVVNPGPYFITTIFGPMLRLGANPWPYFDSSHQAMADFFGGLQESDYVDVWNVPQPGGIAVTNGSALVTGIDTNFQSTFCAGGTVGDNGASVIIWYPIPGSPGQFGRSPYTVASCQSGTSLTLTQPYSNSDSSSSLSYARMDNNSIGTWIGGSTNANYYDNVMAFYNLYFRSGLDDYLNYARTLADRWYTMPWFDQGRACLNGSTTLFPRLQSITGLILRAYDGRPDYWPGIRQYVDYDYSFVSGEPVGGYVLNDIREQGYATAFLALAAMLDPLASSRNAFLTQLNGVISNLWAPSMQPGGNWVNISFGDASWNGVGGTVTVTNGSTTVTGSGTQWLSEAFAGNAFWTADANGVTDGDSISYVATVVSPTLLTLDRPYQGPSMSGRGWQTYNTVGVGTEPFMLGVVGQGFRYAYLATSDPRLPAFIANIEGWLSTEGYRADARGLWYGRVFPNCEPISTGNEWCSGGPVEQSRALSGEIVGALSTAFLITGDTAMQLFGDNIYGAMFGGPAGGPDADSAYVTAIAPGGWDMQTKKAKDFGFFFGYGGGPSWPAARLSPPVPIPAPRNR